MADSAAASNRDEFGIKAVAGLAWFCAALLLSGCVRQPPGDGRGAAAAASAYQPAATFQEVMDSVVDTAADFVWQSVSTTVDAEGTHERKPRTDAEWHQLRQHAITLMEAANLIVVPGRRVAHGTKTVEDGSVLDTDQIQRRLGAQHEQLISFAGALREIGLILVHDADRHDVAAIVEHGATLDEVCEACHKVFWYPDQSNPVNASQ